MFISNTPLISFNESGMVTIHMSLQQYKAIEHQIKAPDDSYLESFLKSDYKLGKDLILPSREERYARHD